MRLLESAVAQLLDLAGVHSEGLHDIQVVKSLKRKQTDLCFIMCQKFIVDGFRFDGAKGRFVSHGIAPD